MRNGQLAQHLGVSSMTIWRWKRNPELKFPSASEVNGIEYTNLDVVDEWMKQRLVQRHRGSK